jgi:hypothetical protein
MLYITHDAIQGTMEAMIIRRREPEDGNASTIEWLGFFGRDIEEIGNVEVLSFDPEWQRMS